MVFMYIKYTICFLYCNFSLKNAVASILTGTVSAVIVDASRLMVYGTSFIKGSLEQHIHELAMPFIVSVDSAFIGAFVGKHMLQKVTLRKER